MAKSAEAGMRTFHDLKMETIFVFSVAADSPRRAAPATIMLLPAIASGVRESWVVRNSIAMDSMDRIMA